MKKKLNQWFFIGFRLQNMKIDRIVLKGTCLWSNWNSGDLVDPAQEVHRSYITRRISGIASTTAYEADDTNVCELSICFSNYQWATAVTLYNSIKLKLIVFIFKYLFFFILYHSIMINLRCRYFVRKIGFHERK